MKKFLFFEILFLSISGYYVFGQEVNTLYFLENAPMRHLVNPAFQPISQGYVNFSPLGYMSLQIGNNSLTFSDIIKNKDGKTITALHPSLNRNQLLRNFKNSTLIGTQLSFSIFSFGFQHKRHGYIHIGMHERFEAGLTIPKSIFNFLLNGGMNDVNGITSLNLKNLDGRIMAYTELYGGYSYHINERWTVGGKVKLLLGQAYMDFCNKNLKLDISHEAWHLHGKADIKMAAPIRVDNLPEQLNYESLQDYKADALFKGLGFSDYVLPQGYGAAIDMGATYSPIKNLQMSFAITDLGFIYWHKGTQYAMTADSSFTGVHNAQFGDYYEYDKQTNKSSVNTSTFINDTLIDALKDFSNALHSNKKNAGYAKMVSPKLIVGLDYTFCHDILNVGLVSKTRLFDNHVYEEVTIGGVVKPAKWFNFALSYSLVQNGEYSNIGAGISLMPYEGVNMTLAMDYIPLSYFKNSGAYIPYKIGNVNFVLGFSIVWGTHKKKDKDKDGVADIYDLDVRTPRGIGVDVVGCSLDSDGDEVIDYKDSCPNTHYSEYGRVDSVGCPPQVIDSDGDGVPDNIDLCPNTPQEALGKVDSLGCAIDSDNDGIPDYLDKCPKTPKEAMGNVDKDGCPNDEDNDGVPDYLDQCPNTPKEASGFVDEYGCIKDTDGDSVPDYLDKCPFKPGPVENNGCPLPKKLIEEIVIGKSIPIRGIQFETGKDKLTDSSYVILQEWLDYLLYDIDSKLVIEGHTDNTGNWAYNVQLSEKRAQIVLDYFVINGINPNRLEVVGYGPSRPIATNSTQEGREENRRVEFKVIKEQQ